MTLDEIKAQSSDMTFDLNDAMHSLVDRQAPEHWCEISSTAEEWLESLAEIEVEYGSPINAVLNAAIAWAYESGAASVARVLGLDAKLVHRACSGALDDEPPAPGTEGLPLLLERMEDWREFSERLAERG